jgi:hypothetical protein
MPAQLGHHPFVIPAAGADKMLHRLAGAAGLGRDRLAGLALQGAQLALQDHSRQVVLLDPIEARQVTPQEALQPPAAASDGHRRNLRLGQQGLRGRVFEQRHPCHSWFWPSSTCHRPVSIPPQEKRLQSN